MIITTRGSDMPEHAPQVYAAPMFPEAASALHQSTTSAEQTVEGASRSADPLQRRCCFQRIGPENWPIAGIGEEMAQVAARARKPICEISRVH